MKSREVVRGRTVRCTGVSAQTSKLRPAVKRFWPASYARRWRRISSASNAGESLACADLSERSPILLILRKARCGFWGDVGNIPSLGLISVTSVRLRPIVLRPRASFSKAVPRPPEGVLGLGCSSGVVGVLAVNGRISEPLNDTPESVFALACLRCLIGSRSSRS